MVFTKFFDTFAYKEDNRKLQTELLIKPSNCHDYLHRHSKHQEKLIRSIPFGQVSKADEMCYDEKNNNNLHEIRKSFVQRGYSTTKNSSN